jgi:hypothetical protein
MLRLQRLGGLILAVALLAGTGWYIRSLHARVAVAEQAAKTAQDALKKRAATSARRERDRAASARAAASAALSLQNALTAQPEWRDQPVPEEVQRALAQD